MDNSISPELIKRINELAKKKKQTGLTEEEKNEQDRLRKQYLAVIRAQFKTTLDSISIVDPEKIH